MKYHYAALFDRFFLFDHRSTVRDDMESKFQVLSKFFFLLIGLYTARQQCINLHKSVILILNVIVKFLIHCQENKSVCTAEIFF